MKNFKLLKDRRKILRSYSFLSMLGNFLIALSISGLAVLGVLSSDIAFPLLAALAISFGLFGLMGRFIDQSLDDVGDTDD